MSSELVDDMLPWDGGHMGEDSGVDLRGPVADHHNAIAEKHIGRDDIQVKVDDEWVTLGGQRFEPHQTPGMLERYVYDHKKGLILVGAVAVGAVITALAATRYVSAHKKK